MEVQAVNPMGVDSCFLNTHRCAHEAKPPSSAAMIKNRKRKTDLDQEIMACKKLKALTVTELIEKPECLAVEEQQLVDEETEPVELKGRLAAIDESNNPVVQKQPITDQETVLKFKSSTGVKGIVQNQQIEQLTVKFKAFTGVGRRLDGEPSKKVKTEERELKKEKEKFQPFTGRSYRLIDYSS